MFTDTAQQGSTATPEAMDVFTRAIEHVHQFICGLHGHDALLHFEAGRMSLQCTSCGHETPGWDLRSAPERADTVDSTRVARMPLVRERRAA